MSNVSFPPPVQGPVSAGQAPSGIPATVPNAPAPIAQATVGTLLTGVVVSEEASGHFLIKTDHGTLPITTRATLALGSQVTLQVRTSGPQLHVTITQIDGQPAHLRIGHAAEAPPLPQVRQGPGSGADGRVSQPALAGDGGSARATTGPPPTPSGLAAAGGGTDAVSANRLTGTVSAAASALDALVRASHVKGFVLADSSGGPLRVRTASGTFEVATAKPLPAGTSVVLHLRPGGPPLGVIVDIDPAPHADISRQVADGAGGRIAPANSATGTAGPAAAQVRTAAPLAPQAPTAAGEAPAIAPSLVGQRLQAVVRAHPALSSPPLPGASVITASPGPGQPLPVGTVLELSISAVGIERATGTGAAPAAAAAAQASGQASQSAPAGAPGAGSPGLSAAGFAAASATQPALEGQVVGRTTQGQPLVQTPLGLLTLESRAALPEGTRVIFELSLSRASLPVETPRQGPLPLIHGWPALQEALDALRSEPLSGATAAAGQSAAAGLANLPQPGPRMTSAILFFLSALTGGDPASWLNGLFGEQGREALQRAARGDLTGRLLQDFAQLGRLADLAGPDWRFLPIPLHDGQQLHQLRLFLRKRHKRNQDDGRRPGDAARFIVEVELSRLGELQLDGLVKERRFDLILRTRQALPQTMQRDISSIFALANEAAGYAGNIGFQASNDWIPVPLGGAPELEDSTVA